MVVSVEPEVGVELGDFACTHQVRTEQHIT